jgi:ABC-2 type transport system permease protein
VTAVLIASCFVPFLAVGRPDGGLARAASFFPATAPMAMPRRAALGAAAWWEPADRRKKVAPGCHALVGQ